MFIFCYVNIKTFIIQFASTVSDSKLNMCRFCLPKSSNMQTPYYLKCNERKYLISNLCICACVHVHRSTPHTVNIHSTCVSVACLHVRLCIREFLCRLSNMCCHWETHLEDLLNLALTRETQTPGVLSAALCRTPFKPGQLNNEQLSSRCATWKLNYLEIATNDCISTINKKTEQIQQSRLENALDCQHFSDSTAHPKIIERTTQVNMQM